MVFREIWRKKVPTTLCECTPSILILKKSTLVVVSCLDLKGIALPKGSACSGGSDIGFTCTYGNSFP